MLTGRKWARHKGKCSLSIGTGFVISTHLLVSGRCRQWEDHLFFLVFGSILHVPFIHGATGPPAAWRGWRRRWQWGEPSGPIGACWCGWDPTSWTLRCGRVADAAHCPWARSLENWMSNSFSSSCAASWGQRCSAWVPNRQGVDNAHVGKWVRRGVRMLAEGWWWCLSQVRDSHPARVGIVRERGRLRASYACHPCPCRDRARILTADLRSHHHIRKRRRGEKVQKGACPSPLYSQYSFSVWAPRKQQQKFLKNVFG